MTKTNHFYIGRHGKDYIVWGYFHQEPAYEFGSLSGLAVKFQEIPSEEEVSLDLFEDYKYEDIQWLKVEEKIEWKIEE